MKIKINTHGNYIPKFIAQGDWVDLKASETVYLKKGEYKLIPLGISMKLPAGYEAHVCPRSSTYSRWRILMVNSMGIIDNSYSGDGDIWHFPALAMEDTVIQVGDRICQFRIMKKQPRFAFKFVTKLKGKNRGGFGSTGKA